MAKKKTVKKPRRRLKKAVRRSLAAVLMITAIVVAAIPVPENLAVNPRDGEGGTTESPVAYVAGEPSGSTDNPYVLPKPESEYQSEAELKAAKDSADARIEQDLGGRLVPTEIVTRYGGELYLTWQFLYESTGNKTGRLLKYNDEFPADLVNLGLQPNASYFAVHENAYNLYFSNPEYLNGDVGPNNEAKDTIRLSNMDNLNPGSLFYPITPIVYTYRNVNRQTGEPENMDSTVVEFFQNYFPQDFASATANFKAYWDMYNRVQQEGGDVNSIETPGALEKKPSDITNENDRKKFFCEHNRILSSLPGYTLEIASDRRLTAGGDRVYLAHGDGNVPADSSYKDVDGYLVQKDDTLITTIAFRAFADVHNVKQIQIDQYVRTIERSAFEKADIASVDIGNARTIGDRAFANCKSLTKISFNETAPTDTIGVEAFYGSGINTKVEFPRHISSIGHGAFANCLDLAEVQFFETGDNCTIGDYAFYGDTRLTSMNFARTVFTRIGKCAFAIAAPSGDMMTDFHFPSEGLEAMDDYILGNRQGLRNVYFENYTRKVPLHTFYNCFNLLRVEFSDKCGGASFDSELFKDVTTKAGTGDNPEAGFCVYGPENYNNSPALPRVSTWDAVRTDGEGVTYVYESGGKKYYEVALDSDGTRYRYAASEDGVLISCALISRTSDPIDLVIPEMIGDIKVNSIGPGCFDDEDLRALIRSITIKNRSITTIGEGVFRDLPRLRKVRIGDSVASIGKDAFAGCKNLEDVYFTKPAAGYEAFEIGENAFVTTGNKLTFHGDIVKGYDPFEWAMNPANVLRDQDSANLPPVNVCYQSLWDSESGTHLTVMPDKDTGEVTLLDYPKFKDLDKDTLRMDDELNDFCVDMEEYYYYTVYNNNNDAYINEMRTEYAYIFEAWRQNTDENIRVQSVTLPDGEVINAGERNAGYVTAMDLRDGPWINPVYCSGSWKDYLTASGGTDSDSNTTAGAIADFLFEPLVAEAAVDPEPYFDRNPYNFMVNYELEQDPDVDPSSLQEYQRVPEKAWGFINATRDVYVPEGVESIDAVAYKDRNIDNYNKYIAGRPVKTMYESKLDGATPGLFSGYFKDYDADDDDREKEARGNDTVQSIVLMAVKEIPDFAFDNCEQLTRLEIPAATKVGSLPFRDCGKLVNLVGSDAYPAERGILYEKHQDGDGNDRYRIVECLLARGRSSSGNEELSVGTVSAATDSLIPFLCETCETDIRDKERDITIPAIAESAFEGCKDIFSVDLTGAQMLKTIPEDCFKDCDNLQQVVLPGSVNKIADGAFQRGDDTARADVTIYGREVDIADTAFVPDTGYHFTLWSYLDSAAKRFTDRHTGIQFRELNAYRVWFYDWDGTPLAGPLTVEDGLGIRDDELPESLAQVSEAGHRPGYTFDGWLTDDGKKPSDPVEKDMTIFVAQYKSDGTMVDGKYTVQFVHGRTGQALIGFGADSSGRYLIVPNTAFTDIVNATENGDALQPPAAVPSPTEDGYVFLNEYRTDRGAVWTPDSIIERNTTVLALFGQSGGNGNTSGGSTNPSGGSTNTSRNSTSSRNSSSNRSSNSTSSSSSSTSSSSTSATSTTSSSVGQYTVFVDGGSGSGSYAQGTTVIISAYVPAEGMRFDNWTTQSNGVTLASTTMSTTTFTMPANNVTVKANYVEGTPVTPVAPSTGGSSGSNTGTDDNNGNGNTRVDIEKPGISNRDLATAVTNGSTDNFIVKITETDEATRAVAAALTNKYGTLDNILYYAMDISLYDSTGTTKITDTTGLSVDITIPIPDSLVAYGGNNMAGAVVSGDQLESLNESFTTINGVPCIRFRATHFSPYTIYVDTGNLVEGMLDVTPKTGDPIHPKWFLSLGLACLSIILFLKKDKRVAVKA